MNAPEHYEIAVVGGGIAGLYCCLKAPPGTRIALFEASDRFGGRLETVPMDGFLAEYGSMRFDPSRQHLVGRLISELKLETEPFPEYTSPAVKERQAVYALRDDEKELNALEIYALAIARVLNRSVAELLDTSEEELEHLVREGKFRNRYLWELGVWNAFSDVISHDAIKYIMAEGSFYHQVHENPGVIGSMITWVKMLQMSPDMKGIKGGMHLITDRMLEKVRDKKVDVFSGHTLQAIEPQGKKLALTFNKGKVTADHAILALPRYPLKAIKGLPEDIRNLFDSVIPIPLLKCFFLVKQPWWREETPNQGVQNLPTRELHYYRQGGKGLVMVYADRPAANFWSGYVACKDHAQAELGRQPKLPLVFAEHMKINPDSIAGYGIRDWARAPYGAGVHLWIRGVAPWTVSERLEAFPLHDGAPRNVHICGEAFSDYQGFMEGALRSAEKALGKVLG